MQITPTDARRAAMDLLARREHGAGELCEKLLRRFYKSIRFQKSRDFEKDPERVLETVPETEPEQSTDQLRALIQVEVDKLTASGLQSDARLAEAFVRSRVNRGQGPIKVKMGLRQKGVDDSLIEQAMAQAEVDWQALAIEIAAKKFAREDFGSKDSNLTAKLRAKRQRFLQQRGFSFEQISAVERE
jgi:regulatory protein